MHSPLKALRFPATNEAGLSGSWPRQPHVPVDSGAFIKPPFSQRCVDSHRQHICAAKIGKICQVKNEGRVTAEIFPDVKAIQNHHGISKGPVKLHGDALVRIGLRKLKDTPVPANARSG